MTVFSIVPRSLLLALLVALGQPAEAQAPPAGAAAITYCLGDRASTWVDVRILETDSTTEILVHEAMHRRQMLDTITAVGRCPSAQTPFSYLQSEVEAFCASFDERVKRMSPKKARADYLGKLIRYYRVGLSADVVVGLWQKQCGK